MIFNRESRPADSKLIAADSELFADSELITDSELIAASELILSSLLTMLVRWPNLLGTLLPLLLQSWKR